jgi:hypothetical protein
LGVKRKSYIAMKNIQEAAGYRGSDFSNSAIAFTSPQVKTMDLPVYLPYSYTNTDPGLKRVTYKS